MCKPELTEEQILRCITKHNGVAKYAAEELGISTSTLLLKLREMGYERNIVWVKKNELEELSA